MSNLVTLDEMKKMLPSRKGAITQEAVDIINRTLTEPEFQGESLAQTAMLYEQVLRGSRASVAEYLNAIRFCAYMVSQEENYTEAYKRVFWNRDFVKERKDLPTDDPKYCELTSAASRYRRSKLVVDILTVSQVPLDLLFSGQRYRALGVLVDVMENGRLDRDRVNAAKEILAATSGADHIKIELDVGVKEDSAIKVLNDQLNEIAANQKNMMSRGVVDLNTIGSMKVIEHDSGDS